MNLEMKRKNTCIRRYVNDLIDFTFKIYILNKIYWNVLMKFEFYIKIYFNEGFQEIIFSINFLSLSNVNLWSLNYKTM